ncbi:MAG: hypothetical protein GEU89_19510 [Kiloniellaceae bacterium]|nr:hypothetical protein [Kiloniellaceae bacterium]
MPQFFASKARTAGRIAGGALLLILLAGCDAIYDDTKGWANRLEASILGASQGTAEAATHPDASADIMQKAAPNRPTEMAPPPAVPIEPVDTTALAALGAPPARQTAPEGMMAAASDALLVGQAEDTAQTAPAAAAAPPDEAVAMPPAPTPKPEVPAEVQKAAQATAKTAADTVVEMVLHLSSLRSEEAAKRNWSDLQRSFPGPLGQMEAEIRRTELGDKGTFYRVLAGPLPSRDKARQVCDALKAKDAKQYCRVMPTKPKA